MRLGWRHPQTDWEPPSTASAPLDMRARTAPHSSALAAPMSRSKRVHALQKTHTMRRVGCFKCSRRRWVRMLCLRTRNTKKKTPPFRPPRNVMPECVDAVRVRCARVCFATCDHAPRCKMCIARAHRAGNVRAPQCAPPPRIPASAPCVRARMLARPSGAGLARACPRCAAQPSGGASACAMPSSSARVGAPAVRPFLAPVRTPVRHGHGIPSQEGLHKATVHSFF